MSSLAPRARMERQAVNPPDLFDSIQHGFSQAVTVAGGRRVFLSGQVATDGAGLTTQNTLAGQLEAAFDNIESLLGHLGGGLRDVAMLRIYLVEAVRDELDEVAIVLKHRFPEEPPAATWLHVAGFAREDWLVEIEAEAVIPHDATDTSE